ncbi:ShlB/FhaC/HecB family hemolysin secretion/activation protein [Variovorax paradoxus]|uniref:Heme/hemopexin transporter protein HuxB n=1 Tax=Variovorax paradoxus TaxID=34073 RepID=A0A0H2LVA8_VARPD|nr:ShlB/FhaC/HecB family hemolysin secretion/activation protein [Variovorax paradoxus]KLN53636.1 heme/hemopexin transporter protein HuxB precursor [Variovorax paradoxus]
MHVTPRIPLSLLGASLALSAATVSAATPDAGQILQEPRAPLAVPSGSTPALTIDKPGAGTVLEGGARVRLSAIRFSGNTAFSNAALQSLLTDAVGKELTFAELTRLTDRATRHYRETGYLVARAYLPAQAVKDGVLDIAVLEGNLGQVTVTNTAGLKDSALAPLQALPLNAPVQAQSLDRTLLTLSDLPGTRVQSTLRPGTTVGASDLLVEVNRTRDFQGIADIDNFGSTYTGQYRVGTSLYWNNPLDRGDQMSLRLQASNTSMHYARLGYQLPLGRDGTRVGVAVSHLDYRLGKDFAALDADGKADTVSLYVRHPLLRSLESNWYAQLQMDAKNLRDTVGSTATTSVHQLRNVVLGLNGDWQDALGGGAGNSLALNLTTGQLRLDNDSLAQDAASIRSAGHFNKLNYQLQRVQALRPNWSLALNLSGQLADRNLASAEKFSLGGNNGVRAYPQGEALGDAGWLASAALRWQPAPGWQLQAFYDAGGVQLNHRAWDRTGSTGNRVHLAGAGLGVGWATDKLAFSLTSGWATEGRAGDGRRGARLWAQATVAF